MEYKYIIKKCPHCYETGENTKTLEKEGISGKEFTNFAKGYLGFVTFLAEKENNELKDICPYCGSKLIDTGITRNDAMVICNFSKWNRDVLDAMVELHQKDIIEYTFKINQMREIVDKEDDNNNASSNISSSSNATPSNTLKCPKCGSTAITTCARGVNGFWGFIGAGKTVNRCGNCGHTWKPRG